MVATSGRFSVRGFTMRRLSTSFVAIAVLATGFLVADTVEAAKSRSAAERRQRPGKGYFANSPSNRSYNNRSIVRSTPRYVTPQTYARTPVTRSAPVVTRTPRRVSTSANRVVRQRYVSPSGRVVQTSPVTRSTRVYRSNGRVVVGQPTYSSRAVSSPRIISERVIRVTPAAPVESEVPATASQPKETTVRRQ
jgi:hypothetical protein